MSSCVSSRATLLVSVLASDILRFIPLLCAEDGIPERSALQLRLESGLCLLARLECLERLHYRLDNSECDPWDLNWIIPSDQSEKFMVKRLGKDGTVEHLV